MKSAPRVSRFALVGVFNTLLDFAILNGLVFAFKLSPVAANILSSGTAMVISYLLNHRFVFKAEEEKDFKQFVTFVAITSFGLFVIGSLGIKLMTEHVTWPADSAYAMLHWLAGGVFSRKFVRVNIAKFSVAIITLIWNYQMYKRFVFVDKTSSHA